MGLGDYMSAFGALLIVLVLIWIIANTVVRFGLVPGGIRKKTDGSKRLHIVEILLLDTKRKLVLVKRDDVEHLLLLGNDRETVIEKNIQTPDINKIGAMISETENTGDEN